MSSPDLLVRPAGLRPAAVLLLMAVLAVVIRINRRLSSEISPEQELRSSEYHYRGLVESLSAIAWEADANDFTYSYVSPHAEDLLGYPLSDWLSPASGAASCTRRTRSGHRPTATARLPPGATTASTTG
jgi:PAS domain-containing protein